jgi:hypothetical protein
MSHPLTDNVQGIGDEATVSHEMTQTVGTQISTPDSGSTDRLATAPRPRVVKPVPEAQRTNPREYQLNQLRRRFSTTEREDAEATVLTFAFAPSDPDFPFEMSDLKCVLRVPHSYLSNGRPSLRVTNVEMDRGYQINVERGFDSLVSTMWGKSLLAMMNELDKRLESFLTSEKAQTVKLVANTGKATSGVSSPSTTPNAFSAIPTALEPEVPAQRLQQTPQQIAEAKAKRESDIRQLEARMGRQPLFFKSPDGLSFSVPFQIRNASKLPIPLQSLKSVKLVVPFSYNLEPCNISLIDVPSPGADAVEAAFARHASAHPEMTLMAHVNHLAQNMHTMATEVPSPVPETAPTLPPSIIEAGRQIPETTTKDALTDRPHIQVIPRPPEWDLQRGEGADTDASDSEYSENESFEGETDEDDGGATIPPEAQLPADTGPDLGVLLSFPSLELYGVELLQLYSVSLTIKCDRCKEIRDVKNIRSRAQNDTSLTKDESCNKCANAMSVGQLDFVQSPLLQKLIQGRLSI